MNVKSNATKKAVQKAAVAHVDNNYLFTDGPEAKENTNVMIKTCNDLQTVLEGNL